MKVSRKQQLENYCEFLAELHRTLGYTSKINLSKMVKDHQISGKTLAILIDHGIVRSEGRKQYEWIGPEPTLEMARMMIQEVSRLNREQKERLTNTKQLEIETEEIQKEERIIPKGFVDNHKVVEDLRGLETAIKQRKQKEILPVLKSRRSFKISLFWGMINIEA